MSSLSVCLSVNQSMVGGREGGREGGEREVEVSLFLKYCIILVSPSLFPSFPIIPFYPYFSVFTNNFFLVQQTTMCRTRSFRLLPRLCLIIHVSPLLYTSHPSKEKEKKRD